MSTQMLQYLWMFVETDDGLPQQHDGGDVPGNEEKSAKADNLLFTKFFTLDLGLHQIVEQRVDRMATVFCHLLSEVIGHGSPGFQDTCTCGIIHVGDVTSI